MRPWMVFLVFALAGTGCTVNSLERHSLVQTGTVTDMRYKELMEDFARIADDHSSLPVYASIYAGTVIITDTATLGSTTVWQHVVGMNGYGSESANPMLNRQAAQNWTVDPIIDPEKLEAMRCAFNWVIRHERLGEDCLALLGRPDQFPYVRGRHFGVLDRLTQMPPNWLGVGRRCDVPAHVCYKAHCGETWVWVRSDTAGGLADFSLIIQDIARVNINSPTLFNPGTMPFFLSFNSSTQNQNGVLDVEAEDVHRGVRITHIGKTNSSDTGDLRLGDVVFEVGGRPVANVSEFRKSIPAQSKFTLTVLRAGESLKIDVRSSAMPGAKITVALGREGQLIPDQAYYRIRADSQGSDPFIRSQVIAVSNTK